MIKALARLAAVLLGILCLLIIVLTWILTTSSGTQLAVHIARQLLPDALNIADVQGQLGSHLVLNNVRYQDDSLQFTMDHITLDWNALALLTFQLHIKQLIVQNADIVVKETEPTKKQSFSLSLPFSYQVDQLQLNNISFKHPDLQGKLNANGYLKLSPEWDWQFHMALDSRLQWKMTQIAINGTVDDHWRLSYKANIADINKIAPQIHGSVTANGDISGAAASPKLHGVVNLQNFTVPGLSTHINAKLNTDIAASLNDQTFTAAVSANNIAIALPELGLTPRITNLKVTLADKILHYNAALQSGPGTLTLQGKTTLTQDPPLSTMTLTGKDLLVSNTPKIKVSVSPDLKIEQQKDGWHVTGKAHIPKANIDLGDTRKTVTLPHETVIINKTGKVEKASSQPFFAAVALTVGNDVHVAMAGLKSKVGGAVTLYEIPNQETRADGKLLLPEGSYDLQGQKLNITNSEIIFVNSPVTNPTLNITASKTIQHAPSATTLSDKQSFIVGLKVTGKADNPIITLFSDPSGWSQPDILSLIVFGQPASTLSNSSMGVLAAAAQALGSKSGKPGVAGQLTGQLQHFFGLSELGLQSTVGSDTDSNATSTSFVLGKYLSPRLYLNYSLGLEGNITLRLRYLLSKHWSVQTQASTVGSGVDLFYSMGK